MTEAEFKVSFRKSFVDRCVTREINHHEWPVTDPLRSGTSDWFFSVEGRTVAVEVKFTAKLPKRRTSKVLTHEVSEPQLRFLDRQQQARCHALVLIGMPSVAVFTNTLARNYTLDEVLRMERLEKVGSIWRIDPLLDFVLKYGASL